MHANAQLAIDQVVAAKLQTCHAQHFVSVRPQMIHAIMNTLPKPTQIKMTMAIAVIQFIENESEDENETF